MRVLVDVNLSPAWAAVLAAHHIEAVHWTSVGDPRAADAELMGYARDHGYVVFTHDLDFGTLLALTRARGPSVVWLKLTSGPTANATDLYKKLVPAHDEWFVRWYAKYQAGVSWHHTGVWIGGYAPPLAYPNPQAGLKPNGDDRFSVSIEPVYGIGQPNPRFDFYNYWRQMHSWMTQPQGTTAYYGNALVNSGSFTADDDTWICLEVHVKLNTDVASSAGAVLEVWKNDALVQRFDETMPVGCWIKDKFCAVGADGPECTAYPNLCVRPYVPLDLQWRSTASLQLDAFWPQNYITQGPQGSVEYTTKWRSRRRGWAALPRNT